MGGGGGGGGAVVCARCGRNKDGDVGVQVHRAQKRGDLGHGDDRRGEPAICLGP